MKTPAFWNEKNWKSCTLWPLGLLYAFATKARITFGKPQKINKPVVCVGNLTAGGTGKTPIAIAIAKLLQSEGKKPFFVSRGYGGTLKGVTVNNQKHTAKEVGDEPLLLSKQAPVIVDTSRFQAAAKAANEGADIIIMDDGFQNPSLHKDLSFIVIDGNTWFGNGFCIPAGPLRETVDSGIKRADAIIIIENKKRSQTLPNLPTFHANIAPIKPENKSDKIIAFAGIGRPEKFYDSLCELGLKPEKTFDFPDHHFYTENELNTIIAEAKNINAKIFTTSKDMVKIPNHLQKHFNVLEIKIQWEDEKKLKEFILEKIGNI